MYSLAKKMIVEKELRRKVSIVELLQANPVITTSQLAEKIAVSQRTIFNDLQSLRYDLPEGWSLATEGNSGIFLSTYGENKRHDLWEYYMRRSLSFSVLKELLFKRELPTRRFLMTAGVSYEALKSQLQKLNKELADSQLKIVMTRESLKWQGEEVSIRVFYHRLLLPFTHQHFFFEDYQIHESYYYDFLEKLARQGAAVATEEVFGVCWFFINTIRIKAGCRIEAFPYQETALFLRYSSALVELYGREGVRLQGAEAFFCWNCFVESWGYLISEDTIQVLKADHGELFPVVAGFLRKLTHGDLLAVDEELVADLVLFLAKYSQSEALCGVFLQEYSEVLTFCQENFSSLFQEIDEVLKTSALPMLAAASVHVTSRLVLLIQTAILRVGEKPRRCFLIYQGEPAWKQFLIQELQELLGGRMGLFLVEPRELAKSDVGNGDFIVSNIPVDVETEAEVVYISTIGNTHELQEFASRVRGTYL